MDFIILCVLCVVQGLTEFLPVSSSGHLLFFEQIFGIKENFLFLNLFLHVATLLAVIIVYRKIIWKLLKKPFQPLTYKLVLSTVITVVFALTYEILDLDRIITNFYGFCFIFTSILLFFTFIFQKKSSCVSVGEIGIKSSILVGFVQGLAVLPGISRSGSTISSLILAGNDEEKAAEYSFLLSIPIIIGGFLFELFKIIKNNTFSLPTSPILCVVAFLITFFVSLLSLKITLKLLKKNKFIIFSIYTLIIGIIVIVFNFI